MLLSLKYGVSEGTAKAALIAGAGPSDWFPQINRWGVPLEEMEWYVLPASRQTPAAGGLFVIFKDASAIKGKALLEPYREFAPNLFIPLCSRLYPEVTEKEWTELLIWDRQLFHPLLGFVGFDLKDRVEPSTLLDPGTIKGIDWSFADAGLPARNELTQIVVLQPRPEGLVESLKAGIGDKSLEEMPGVEKEPSLLKKIFNRILLMILMLISRLFFSTGKTIQKKEERPEAGNVPQKRTLSERVKERLFKKIDDLQKERDREIERLLKLFDENQKDALEYAIPLSSPYFNRGETTRGTSSKLRRRPAVFNALGLGGGRYAEVWDVDNYRDSLSRKYHEAAKKEIAQKDFQRAAYIYAHLLGDYHTAANCLVQGRLYREAAVLYRDHLRDKVAAAECLDRGGLYYEAINVYNELGDYEEAGNLYEKIGDRKNALASYEKQIEEKTRSSDYLAAARILDEKINDQARAKQILLKGWQSQYQPDRCLRYYFDMVSAGDEPMSGQIKQVYEQQLPPEKRVEFLDILRYVKEINKEKAADQLIEDIAYEIINDQVCAGQFSVLNALPSFVPGDQLLKKDSQRYISGERQSLFVQHGKKSFSIDQTIKWMRAIRHGDQILILGHRNGYLQLVRLNEEGRVEYFSWKHEVTIRQGIEFIHADPISNLILLQAAGNMIIEKKTLPTNKYFRKALELRAPHWIQNNHTRVVITGDDEMVSITLRESEVVLNYYNINGELRRTLPCENAGPWVGRSVLFLRGLFLSYFEKQFRVITKEGKAQIFELGSGIRKIVGIDAGDGLKVLVSTYAGFFLFVVNEQGQLHQQPGVFMEDVIPSSLTHLGNNILAMTQNNTVMLVSLSHTIPEVFKQLSYERDILAVLPGHAGKNSIVIIEVDGKINIDRFETS